MPSKNHERIKNMLNSAARRMKEKNQLPSFAGMRPILELSTLFALLPWGVSFKPTVLRNKHCVRTVNAEVIMPNYPTNTSQIILYLHGGGYTLGSSHTHRSLVGKIAKLTNRIAILPEYRKAPENPFPAALEDAVFSVKALLERGKKPEDIVVIGDSAGGGLALATQLKLKELGLPQTGACVCISPWVDLAATGDSIELNKAEDPLVDKNKMHLWAKYYSGSYEVTHPLISPLYADLHGLNPILIQVSSGEMLYDDSVRLAQKAKESGVDVTIQIWEGLMHWWHIFQRRIPEAADATEKIADYITAVFERNTKII